MNYELQLYWFGSKCLFCVNWVCNRLPDALLVLQAKKHLYSVNLTFG